MRITFKRGAWAHISQQAYIESIIKRFNMVSCAVTKTPMSYSY